jgi:hypothetical protein
MSVGVPVMVGVPVGNGVSVGVPVIVGVHVAGKVAVGANVGVLVGSGGRGFNTTVGLKAMIK